MKRLYEVCDAAPFANFKVYHSLFVFSLYIHSFISCSSIFVSSCFYYIPTVSFVKVAAVVQDVRIVLQRSSWYYTEGSLTSPLKLLKSVPVN